MNASRDALAISWISFEPTSTTSTTSTTPTTRPHWSIAKRRGRPHGKETPGKLPATLNNHRKEGPMPTDVFRRILPHSSAFYRILKGSSRFSKSCCELVDASNFGEQKKPNPICSAEGSFRIERSLAENSKWRRLTATDFFSLWIWLNFFFFFFLVFKTTLTEWRKAKSIGKDSKALGD